MADNRGETKLYGQVGFEVTDPTPHKKVRGEVAGQVSPPAKKKQFQRHWLWPPNFANDPFLCFQHTDMLLNSWIDINFGPRRWLSERLRLVQRRLLCRSAK